MITKMLQNFNDSSFRDQLIKWYEENKRDLPWRENQDPYKVWISEIMLQQTQVITVIPYFKRFISKYPTIYDLAYAETEEVLKEWEGLGYYSRARNLQHAVREVVADYNGKVPENKKELGALKGIGPYTRGAILSIAFNQAEPAVDGNVMRVLSRVLKIEDNISEARVRKQFEEIVRRIISHEDPSSFNQGIMELGALICTPKSPKCTVCPVSEHCRAYAEGIQTELPIKTKAKKQKRIPYIVLLVRNKQGKYIVEKRPDKGLLASMWQFPMVPIDEIGLDHLESFVHGEYGLNIKLKKKKGKLNHIFSHIIWQLEAYNAELEAEEVEDERLRLVTRQEMDNLPFPVSHLNLMEYLES